MEQPLPPATTEELEAVMARYLRRRRRTIALGVAAFLVAGLLVGRALDDANETTTDRVAVRGGVEEAGGASPDQEARAGDARSRAAAALGGGYVPLGFRTTDAGIDLRLYEVPSPAPECLPDRPCMPPECHATSLHVAASNREAVASAGAYVSGRPGPEELWLLTWSTFGVLEGGPATLALVAPGAGIASVRFEGAAADEVVVDGPFVALGVPGDGDRRLIAVDGEDNEVDVVTIDEETQPEGIGDPRTCQLQPPAVPEDEGGPDDRAAAEAEIRDVVTRAYTSVGSPDRDNADLIEDGDELAAVREEIVERYGNQEVDVRIELGDEITFQGPERAAFRYTLVYNGNAIQTDHIGRAAFQDGRWKVARSMFCATLAPGGITCD